MNRKSIHAWLGPLALALAIAGIVAGTLRWPVAVGYALFVLMLAVAVAAGRGKRDDRR